MLYQILYQLTDAFSLFNVFRYITVRSALAGSTAFLLCVMLGPMFIEKLRRLSIGQSIREEGPQSHQKKAGTPTMGGILILFVVLVSVLCWADLSNQFVWVQLFATTSFALVGAIDDSAKVMKRKNLGLTASGKMALLLIFALVTALWMFWLSLKGLFTTELFFPFFKTLHPDLGLWFIPFAILVLLAATNAVNLTDGLDGLAIGTSGIAFVTYTVFAYVTANVNMATYLDIPHILQAGELVVFGAAISGACLGFLWHNAHPADVFMGDTGALLLGGALGTMALLTAQPLVLVIVGGIFVIEALSVILQVGSYKFRKKRIFRMAPIHHHFELKGWHESKVIIRFWIVAVLLAIFSLSTLKLR